MPTTKNASTAHTVTAKTKYTYAQHPHAVERETVGPPTVKHTARRIHKTPLGRFNDSLGLGITRSVGTMWAAYLFCGLTLVSLPAAIMTGSPIIIVAWIAQTFLQLVLLPIIIVGQNIQAAAADARALATYEDATAILAEAREIQSHLEAQDEDIEHILNKLLKLEKGLLSAAQKA